MLALEESEDITCHPDLKADKKNPAKNGELINMFLKKELRCLVACLDIDGQQIRPMEDKCLDFGKSYNSFLEALPKDENIIAAVYIDIDGEDKCIFVTWCPDAAYEKNNNCAKPALLLNTTKYLLRTNCPTVLNVNASELDELDAEEIKEQIQEGRPPTAVSGFFTTPDFSQFSINEK